MSVAIKSRFICYMFLGKEEAGGKAFLATSFRTANFRAACFFAPFSTDYKKIKGLLVV